MILHILLILLITVAGFSNAVMDVLNYRYHKSIFRHAKNQQWWNPQISWLNKWKNGDYNQGESFWGSSRWFVRFTDAWHFFQGLMFTSLFVVVIVYDVVFVWWLDYILMYALFTTVFSVCFNKLLILRKL
jgi:hypothetical protein